MGLQVVTMRLIDKTRVWTTFWQLFAHTHWTKNYLYPAPTEWLQILFPTTILFVIIIVKVYIYVTELQFKVKQVKVLQSTFSFLDQWRYNCYRRNWSESGTVTRENRLRSVTGPLMGEICLRKVLVECFSDKVRRRPVSGGSNDSPEC